MSAILINESGKRNISSQNFTFNWGIIWNALSPLVIVIGFAILMSIGLRAGYSLEYFVFILLFSTVPTDHVGGINSRGRHGRNASGRA